MRLLEQFKFVSKHKIDAQASNNGPPASEITVRDKSNPYHTQSAQRNKVLVAEIAEIVSNQIAWDEVGNIHWYTTYA